MVSSLIIHFCFSFCLPPLYFSSQLHAKIFGYIFFIKVFKFSKNIVQYCFRIIYKKRRTYKLVCTSEDSQNIMTRIHLRISDNIYHIIVTPDLLKT